MAFSKGFALKTQQKSGKTAQNKASGSRKQATGQPETASWRDFMPGRITLQDALDDPDPLFPSECGILGDPRCDTRSLQDEWSEMTPISVHIGSRPHTGKGNGTV